VVFHWRHFLDGRLHAAASPIDLPFYASLRLLYDYGRNAVELFFVLSGFIFHWLYARRIANREVSAGEFFIRRFSRLYPLHFATLLFVAIAQLAYWSKTGSTFVYEHNDAYHFQLHVFMISEWGFADGPSFNGPVWSVSIEVALYLLFFLVCRWIGANAWLPLAAVGIGYVLDATHPTAITHAMIPFFAGGVAHAAFDRIVRRDRTAIALTLLVPLTLALWALAVSGVTTSLWRMHTSGAWRAYQLCTGALLLPVTILCLAVLETRHGTIARHAAVLGDVSYSSYLLHFPLQLLCALLVMTAGIEPSILVSRPFMLAFFAVLLALSYASYRWFERPIQLRLRTAWQRSRRSSATLTRPAPL
jgi:peptidoglycan/LPS O-acetylase OafA/YrhL